MKKGLYLLITILFFNCNNELFEEPQEMACDNGTYIGDVVLETQDEIEAFGAECFSAINGDLIIGNNDIPNSGIITDIHDLSALESLVSVSDELYVGRTLISDLNGLHNLVTVHELNINQNQNLESLNAVSNLNAVNELNIDNNDILLTINGFDNLSSMYSISFWSNDNLISIDGFSNLSTLDFFIVQHNDNLQSISGFESLPIESDLSIHLIYNAMLSSVTIFNEVESLKVVVIAGCSMLDSLNLLSSLKSVSTTLGIAECHGLTDLQGLNNLETVGIGNEPYPVDFGLIIVGNNNLLNFNGLENLDSVQGQIYIGTVPWEIEPWGNQLLSDLCALQNLFLNGIYPSNEYIQIENNAYNPTVQNIIEGNCSL